MNLYRSFLLICLNCLFLTGFTTPPADYVATVVFLGYTEQPAGTMRTVRDIDSFRRSFGSAPASIHPGKRTDALPDFLLDHALQLFWANGGKEAIILSVGQFSGEGKRPQAAHFTRVIRQLQNPEGPDLILMPDIVQLAFPDYIAVCQAALLHAATNKQFVILDLQASKNGDTASSAADFRNSIGNQDLSFGAIYWPYLQTQLPLSASGERAILPPSAAVAGNIIKTDHSKGVWKAPAGLSVSSVLAPLQTISQPETEQLTQHSSGISINTLKAFSGKGILIWGARTLAGNDNEWRYIPVRRLANHLEHDVRALTAFVSAQPNNPATWQQVKTVVSNRLQTLYRAGAFQGNKAEEAYFVKIGLGETMTQADLNAGRMHLLIGVAPTRPAEFIVLQLQIK